MAKVLFGLGSREAGWKKGHFQWVLEDVLRWKENNLGELSVFSCISQRQRQI